MRIIAGMITLLFCSPLMAATCLPLESYEIKKPVSFANETPERSFSALLAETPISVSKSGHFDDSIKLSASDIIGPLDQVIKSAADSANIVYSYSVPDCELTLSVATPVMDSMPDLGVIWEFKSGESLKNVLTRWSEQADWRLSYEIDGRIILGDSLRFNGSYETAVINLLTAIKESNKIAVSRKFYRGNKMLRIYRSALVEADQNSIKREQ